MQSKTLQYFYDNLKSADITQTDSPDNSTMSNQDPKMQTNLEQGLEWITEWYKWYEQNNNMREITEQQIEKFQKLL